MKKMFKTLSLATSIAVSAGFAGQAAAVVTEAANGQGDLQFVPVATLSGGWQTEVSLINSSTTMSTVSKAVIRSQVNSDECLDFMIYLSPGDRMVGKFMEASSLPAGTAVPAQANGSPATYVFYSTDDSVRALDGSVASAAKPAVYPLQDVDGGCGISYVEIIESAAFNLGPAVVAKTSIINAHDAAIAAGGNNAVNAPVNTISGDYTLMNTINGVKMSDQMDTFMEYDNSAYLTVTANTILGENTDEGMAGLEAAMAKQALVFPYEHDDAGEMTIAAITFPTKMFADTQGVPSTYTPFSDDAQGIVGTATTIRDMEERIMTNVCTDDATGGIISPPPTPCTTTNNPESLPAEVNLIVMEDKIASLAVLNFTGDASVVDAAALAANFKKGWANVNLEEDNTDGFTGAPALTQTIQFSTNSLGALNGTLKGAAND